MIDKTLEKVETKTCESCGKDFSCGARTQNCWCFAVELSQKTLAKLQEDFKTCLCKDCLLNYGKKEK